MRWLRRAPLVLVPLVALLGGPGCVRSWVFRQLPQPVVTATPVVPGLADTSAATCGACHAEIAAEWASSRMGQAWTDPVFQADFVRTNELYACRYCHTPLPDQRPEVITGLSSLMPIRGDGTPNPTFSPALQAEGVTCAVCHVHDGAVEGTLGVSAPHPTRTVAALTMPCERCHAVPGPPLSKVARPVSDTPDEWRRWQAATGRTESCVDCHMPPVERPLMAGQAPRPGRHHHFPGSWDDAFVRSALDVRRDGDTLVLTNLAGHNFPTADPARVLEVWFDDTVVRLERVIRLPRYVEERDTTLLPGESRRIPVPPGARRIQVVFDRLGNDPALAPAADRETRVVVWSSAG